MVKPLARLPAGIWGKVATPNKIILKFKIMFKNKTRRLYIRLSEEEIAEIKRRSSQFDSMSHFVKEAIKEFSDTTITEKLETRKRLAELYKSIDEKLAHVGGNLNQAMRRINESAKANLPYNAIMQNDFMPRVQECYQLCLQLRRELEDITIHSIRK